MNATTLLPNYQYTRIHIYIVPPFLDAGIRAAVALESVNVVKGAGLMWRIWPCRIREQNGRNGHTRTIEWTMSINLMSPPEMNVVLRNAFVR